MFIVIVCHTAHRPGENIVAAEDKHNRVRIAVMTALSHGNDFHIIGPLCGESTGHRWIPLTKGQLCEALMYFFVIILIKVLNKQLSWRLFYTLWRWYDVNVM